MSNSKDLGNEGGKIKPSARKSIHSHSRCIFKSREEMVRYGDDSSDDERPAPSAASTDEVDNVMSKMAYTSSPRLMNKPRRTSLTPPNLHYSDDSDDEESKAWKAQSPTIANHLSRTNGSIATPISTRTQDRSNSSYSSSFNQSRLNQSHRNQESKSIGGTMLFSGLTLLGILSAVFYYEPYKSSARNYVYDELRFHSDLNELGAKYRVGGDSILQLQTGISTVYRKEDTSCLIFVYNSKREDFDQIEFDGFVNNVASNAAKFLRNDTSPIQHSVIEGSELKMGSHSQLVKAYRDEVARAGVLLIRDLDHVPSPLAMAFHYYCDEYNPLAKKSAIFFTLNSAECHNSDEKSSHASVEKCLKKKWSTVPKDNIGPLLTRVVSVVVDITSGH